MNQQTEAENRAERVAVRSHKILWASAAAFMGWQAAYFMVFQRPGSGMRTVDVVVTAGLLAWVLALLVLLATGGGLFAGREVRRILDDELAKANRAVAYRNAFWAMMSIAFAGYVMAQLMPIGELLLAHATLSAGVIVAALTMVALNRR
jgi:hypothetical protein